jgi:hypothetical protein
MARVIDNDSRVTASASTDEAPPPQTDRPRPATNPYVGILGVFFGNHAAEGARTGILAVLL